MRMFIVCVTSSNYTTTHTNKVNTVLNTPRELLHLPVFLLDELLVTDLRLSQLLHRLLIGLRRRFDRKSSGKYKMIKNV